MNPSAFDVVIIGAGGAGLTAAIYTARANLSTLILEKMVPGGQIVSTELVENYPGFQDGIMGAEIAQRMEAQAARYGARLDSGEVNRIFRQDGHFQIEAGGERYQARAVILAMGASFRTLGVPNEKEFTGKGVSYCATCDGAFFRGKELVVVGGGDSALQEGIFLTKFAAKVSIVHRRDKLRASPILQERALENPKIRFIWDTVIDKIEGAGKVESVLLRNVKTQALETFGTGGVFIFIGHEPNSGIAKGFVATDDHGYVIAETGYRTSVPGVFAAGEIRKGAVHQLVSACGEGCGAALALQAYLESSN
ncbi:MAG: Thioredoxin reductase [Candidatus Omnitrophica bacterium ADurb.Bin314]|nr:MAG: Thioredoxin reductase [Candidatus Omnitrophica bacterium ADurb.Bin314]HOE68708.1 thioredoxin-disulfide reductase [Candidatus Omnitrophota bacterium]